MSSRERDVADFLAGCGWGSACQEPFSADFSSRRYVRLKNRAGDRAVLMIAEEDQKTREFVAVAKVLFKLDISAPEIYAAEPGKGLVLMEDFGDANFGRMMDDGADPLPLYKRGIDVLAHLHKSFNAEKCGGSISFLPTFDAELFARQAGLFLDGYIPYLKGREATEGERQSFYDVWRLVLVCVKDMPQTLLLRDYMPDNLMSLSGRNGWRDTGVLDFQDAGFGPAPYDIASICEHVRRDRKNELLDDMIDYYLQINPIMKAGELKRACCILSAQRHTRILGILAKRPEKRGLLPRTLGYMNYLLRNDALCPVRDWFQKNGIVV